MAKIRMMRYSKPYAGMVILAIALLFAQANCELALPDYLSQIVNVGIQQGGIDNAVPVAIRKIQMDRSTIFMNSENKSMVLSDYTLINDTSPDYDKYLEIYPALINESIYVLKDVNNTEIERLNPVMGQSILIVYTIEQIVSNQTLAAQMNISFGGMDLSKMDTTTVFYMLSHLPASQIENLTNSITIRFSALGDKMIIQAAARPIKAEYDALGMDTNKLQMDYLWRVGGLMILLTLLSMVCTIAVGYFSAKTATGMARDIRRDIFQKVESFSNTEFDSFSTASLITRTTNDITQIQMVIMMIIRMVFYAPIIGIGGIIRALGKASSMWWLIAVAVVTLVCIILLVFSIALPKFKMIQKFVDRLNLVARENLTGMMVIRAFNQQQFEETRFDKANVDLTKISLFINRLMVIMMPLMMLIMSSLTLAIVWVGAHEVADANMQVGDMMAFMQYAMQIVMAFLMMSIMFIMLPRASVSADRIAEVLKRDPIIQDPESPKTFPDPFNSTIEFRNVSFRYHGAEADALHNISFTAKPGQMTAFIGATGSGKSTLVNLIPRFYEVSSGAVLVDNIDIREVTQHDLRDKIGYVPQKTALFSGTIESNLRYADENASDDTIKNAIDISQAAEFVTSKPEGLQTPIAQGGMNVSGGQKQRMSIARAIIKKPPIYILDDSFSALDFKTDAALRKAFKKQASGSTLIVVTQRVSTIMNADQIIVLDEGRIVGKGSHAELMKSCEIYKGIALSQMSMEELI